MSHHKTLYVDSHWCIIWWYLGDWDLCLHRSVNAGRYGDRSGWFFHLGPLSVLWVP